MPITSFHQHFSAMLATVLAIPILEKRLMPLCFTEGRTDIPITVYTPTKWGNKKKNTDDALETNVYVVIAKRKGRK